MNRSEQINELAAALAKAQAKMRPASMDAENPAFKRGNKTLRYADLASVWDAIREPLTSNGIAVVQTAALSEHGVTVECLLVHTSGQWVEGSLTVPLEGARQTGAHAVGSATSYGRRYLLAAMCGVVQDDDDGNEATKGHGASPNSGRLQDAPNIRADVAEAAAERMRVLAAIKEAAEMCPEIPRPESGKLPAPGKLGVEAKRPEDVLFVEAMLLSELTWHEGDLEKQIAKPDSMGKRDGLSATLAAIREQKAWRVALKRAYDAKQKDGNRT